ncbi:15651_t:CDS:10 [Entrophospora sp. SA101]|nr:15651_t:CDS:10 [Entrophospora sp. SA101]
MNFYKQAAEILEKLLSHKGSIKSLTLADNIKEKKKMYAIICETLKYKDVLNIIIENSGFLGLEKKVPKNLAMVLIYDLLFSRNGLKLLSDGYYKQAILRNEIRLRVINQFIREGYKLEYSNDDDNDLSKLRPKTIRRDKHLPDLLILPPNTDLHKHKLYISGEIVLQDKSSCFPSFICSPTINSHVIDACAAPGNKTSHLSSVMKNSGKIWAFDLDKQRLNLLKKLTEKAGCKIEFILLDPSCSGSGIVNHLDRLINDSLDVNDDDGNKDDDDNNNSNDNDERIKNLSEFQERIILHAFKFPYVKRIVYSTCSINVRENEHVVRNVLKQTDDFTLADRKDVLEAWPRRGNSNEIDEELADKLVCTSPKEDFTNGFFVACQGLRVQGPVKKLSHSHIDVVVKYGGVLKVASIYVNKHPQKLEDGKQKELNDFKLAEKSPECVLTAKS